MLNLYNSKYSFLIHITTWIGISLVHFLGLWIGLSMQFDQAMLDAFVTNGLFALISIGLWFVVDHFKINNKISYDQIITILTSFALSILIWLYASTHILRLIFSDDSLYLHFLDISFNFRIVVGVTMYVISFLFFFLAKTIKQLRDKEEHEKRITKLLKQTELDALKSQINPHFLFNSLNSINALTQSNPEKASEMILQLSDYMRYSLNQQGNATTSLAHEIDNLNKYLAIEKIRFGEKLNYTLNVDENSLKMKIPPMLLQSLFENAIKHGLYSLSEGFYLCVDIESSAHSLLIHMKNNFDKDFPSKERNGLGINNVKNRLLNIFGRADLMFISTEDEVFNVRINIPQYE